MLANQIQSPSPSGRGRGEGGNTQVAKQLTIFLESFGFEIFWFWINKVLGNLDVVLNEIIRACEFDVDCDCCAIVFNIPSPCPLPEGEGSSDLHQNGGELSLKRGNLQDLVFAHTSIARIPLYMAEKLPEL